MPILLSAAPKRLFNLQIKDIMKENKPENQKKESRKAAKKALEQSLTSKLFEAVKSLGHDAEKIGEDLVLVSKFVAKKISKRVKGSKKAPKPVVAKAKKSGKKLDVPEQPIAETLPVAPVMQVDAASAMETPNGQPKATASKPVKVVASKAKTSNHVVKTNKPVKTTVKKAKPVSDTDKEQLN